MTSKALFADRVIACTQVGRAIIGSASELITRDNRGEGCREARWDAVRVGRPARGPRLGWTDCVKHGRHSSHVSNDRVRVIVYNAGGGGGFDATVKEF